MTSGPSYFHFGDKIKSIEIQPFLVSHFGVESGSDTGRCKTNKRKVDVGFVIF